MFNDLNPRTFSFESTEDKNLEAREVRPLPKPACSLDMQIKIYELETFRLNVFIFSRSNLPGVQFVM